MGFNPGGNSSSIGGSSDATVSNPASGQVLAYNGSKWYNGGLDGLVTTLVNDPTSSTLGAITSIVVATQPPQGTPVLTASAGAGQVNLSVTGITGTATYQVYRGTSAGVSTSGSPIATFSATTYVDSAVTASTTYYYKVVPVNSKGAGTASNEASATPTTSGLAAPTNLTAVISGGQVTISWTAPTVTTGVVGYIVARDGVDTTGAGAFSTTIGLTQTTFAFTSLVNGSTYNLSVRSAGNGSSSAAITIAATPLNAPVGLAATTPSSGTIALAWTAPTVATGITGYKLSYIVSGSIGGTPTTATLAASPTTDSITGLTNGTAYDFTLTATGAGGASSSPVVITATPVAGGSPGTVAPPTNLTANGATSGAVTISWTAPSNMTGVTGYTVARDGVDSTGYGAYSTTLGTNITSFTFTNLVDGTPYHFTVQSVGANASSSVVTVTASSGGGGGSTVPAPTNLTAVAADSQVTISWTAPSNMTGISNYYVARDGIDSTGAGPYNTLIPTTLTSFTFTSLLNGTAYHFTVHSVGTAGGSGTVTNSADVTTTSTPVAGGGGGGTVTPGTNPKGFKAFANGSSCVDGPNGNFNRWLGKTQKGYSTWGGEGNIWDILQPTGVWGSNSVGSLGDYDIDAAGQISLANKGDWGPSASGSLDGTLRSMCASVAGAWGNRQGYVYLRPWHEFNGGWYSWSVFDGQQANFIATWKRFVSIFRAQFGTDQRFKIEWSPNRDCSFGYNVLTLWPGSDYVDCIGLDYYDNFGQYHMTQTDWNNEQTATQNGGPLGITQWLNFASQQGVPMRLPEWANQYGDEPVFIQNMYNFFNTNRYTGTGSPGGKMIGANYYNQTGSGASISTNSDFLIELNGANCPDRPNASALYHSLWSGASWM